jgi:Tol biopolymer transport system component/DNA-binding winged helix-turn-helix (wHTH) protein
MSVVGRGETGRLTPKMLAVLLRLAERPGEIVTRADLIASAWPDSHPTDDALSFAVRELRRALGDDARAPSIIETVHGVGYRIMARGVVREEGGQESVPRNDAALQEQALQESVPGNDAPRLQNVSTVEMRLPARRLWAIVALASALAVFAAMQWHATRSADGRAIAPAPAPSPVFVTSDAGAEEFPALSPDGAFVAYSERATPEVRADIRIKSVGGPDARAVVLTDTPDVSELWPSWSPDGQWIAYQALSNSGHAIMISAASGGPSQRLASLEQIVLGRMDWSADGRHLLASLPVQPLGRGPRLHVISVQDGSMRRLRHDLDGSGWDLDPAYSHDGEWIAFRHGVAPRWDVYVIPSAGGAARRLTHLGTVRPGLAWTADGEAVVFSTEEDGRSSIMTVSLGEARVRPTGLVDASAPHVARRVARLTFQRPLIRFGMARVGHHGKDAALSAVASSTGTVRVFAASPERGRVAYLSDRGGREQLWVHDAGQGSDRAYDVQGKINSLAWTDDGRGLLLVVGEGGLDHAMRLDLDNGRVVGLGLARPVLRQLVDGGAPDRLFGLVEHDGPRLARFDRRPDGWQESRGPLAHRLVRVAGSPGVFANTYLDVTKILHVDDELTIRSIDVPAPLHDWTADGDAIWYTSAANGIAELRRHPLGGVGHSAWPLPTQRLADGHRHRRRCGRRRGHAVSLTSAWSSRTDACP